MIHSSLTKPPTPNQTPKTPPAPHAHKIHPMPPVTNRKGSNARAEQAWNLRVTGRTWPEIARELHYGTANSARKAVTTWLKKNPNDDLEILRRASGAMIVSTTRKLDKALDEAIESGKTRDAAELGKAIFDGIEKHAKLTGQHVVQPKQIDVTVTQTLSEVLADTRDRLLSVIDAEVVELPQATPKAVEA